MKFFYFASNSCSAIRNHFEPLKTDTGNSLTTGTFSSQACKHTLTHIAKTMGHFCAWETTLVCEALHHYWQHVTITRTHNYTLLSQKMNNDLNGLFHWCTSEIIHTYLISKSLISLCISKTPQREKKHPAMINKDTFLKKTVREIVIWNILQCFAVWQALDAALGTFKTLKEDIEICNYADTGSQIWWFIYVWLVYLLNIN